MLATRVFLSLSQHLRPLALLTGGVVAVVVAVSLGKAYLELQQPINTQALETGDSVRAIPDLASLTRQADLVVVGRVAGEGVTRLLTQPAQTPAANPPPRPPTPPSEDAAKVANEKGTGIGNPPPPPAALQQQGQITITRPQTPITSYDVQVETVVRGNPPTGQQISVIQPGGTISVPTLPGGPVLTRTVQIEGDTPLRAGERYVLFLKHGENGEYYVEGGAQGRLSVDAAGTVHPRNPGAPATRAYDGQSLNAFVAAVTAVR